MNIELRYLRHFVAVAEEQHFGRAADRLGMAQPPLSQSIMRLEVSLGVKLLDRIGRSFALTSAGRTFLDEARQVLARTELAVEITRRVASGAVTRLRIGCMPWSLLPALPHTIREFREEWPSVEIRVYEWASKPQLEALRNGSLDLGILTPDGIDIGDLTVRKIEHTSSMAAVPSNWDIGKRTSIRFVELAPYPFIMFPKRWNEDFLTRFHSQCAKAGFMPNITQEAGQPYTMLAMVSNELGITLVQSTARHLKVEGVTFVPISDLPSSFSYDIALAWVANNTTPALKAFVTMFEKATIAAGG